MTGLPTSRQLPDKVSFWLLYMRSICRTRREEGGLCWLQKSCCTVNCYIVITGRTSTMPTSDVTRPGAWSEKIGAGNVCVDLQESVRVVVTNHTCNTHLGLTVVRLGTEGPSLHSRQERTKSRPSFWKWLGLRERDLKSWSRQWVTSQESVKPDWAMADWHSRLAVQWEESQLSRDWLCTQCTQCLRLASGDRKDKIRGNMNFLWCDVRN